LTIGHGTVPRRSPGRFRQNRTVTLGRRTTAWRPLADLLGRDTVRPEQVRERVERLDLPAAQRALLLELLDRD
jgi:hypothetical protein